MLLNWCYFTVTSNHALHNLYSKNFCIICFSIYNHAQYLNLNINEHTNNNDVNISHRIMQKQRKEYH